MFQLLCAFNFANNNNKKIALNRRFIKSNGHSTINYFETIFNKFTIQDNIQIKSKHHEINCFDFGEIPNDSNLLIIGFFQNKKYLGDIPNNFHEIINLPQLSLQKLSNFSSRCEKDCILKKSMFIHFRLGDYYLPVFSPSLDVGLLKDDYAYYKNALTNFDVDSIDNIYILSNDLGQAKTIIHKIIYDSSKIKYVDGNEIECLMVMSQCEFGGICANSTFSWWGAYLNKLYNISDHKSFIFPKKWILTHSDCNIQFDGSILIEC